MYYTTQPIENDDLELLEMTMKMINAETQLLFSSDYPHWDFNLPSTIYDLPVPDRGSQARASWAATRRSCSGSPGDPVVSREWTQVACVLDTI